MTTTAKRFTIPGTEIYWDPEIYAREMEVVFGSAWLFVGHETSVPQPGDFLSNYMGNDPVILVRDRSAKLARLPQPLPPPRQQGLPLRQRRGEVVPLRVPRLDATASVASWQRCRCWRKRIPPIFPAMQLGSWLRRAWRAITE